MSATLLLVSLLSLIAVLATAFRNRRRNALVARLPGPTVFVPLFGSMLELLVKVFWMGEGNFVVVFILF